MSLDTNFQGICFHLETDLIIFQKIMINLINDNFLRNYQVRRA